MLKVVIIQVSKVSIRKAISWPDICRLGCEGNNNLFELVFCRKEVFQQHLIHLVKRLIPLSTSLYAHKKTPVPLSNVKCIEQPLEGLNFFSSYHMLVHLFSQVQQEWKTYRNFMRLCLSKNSDFNILGLMFKCSVKHSEPQGCLCSLEPGALVCSK